MINIITFVYQIEFHLRYCGYANEVGEAFRAQTAHMQFKGLFMTYVGYIRLKLLPKSNKYSKKQFSLCDKQNKQILSSVSNIKIALSNITTKLLSTVCNKY